MTYEEPTDNYDAAGNSTAYDNYDAAGN